MPPSVTLLPVTYDPNAFIDNIYTNLQRLEVGVEQAESSFPIGSIILWYGTPANVPAGWAICDGTLGTPNLKGRVPVGFDAAQAEFDTLGETGGAKTHTLVQGEMPQHQHAGTVAAEGQEHTHSLSNHQHWANLPDTGNHRHMQDLGINYAWRHGPVGTDNDNLVNNAAPNRSAGITYTDHYDSGAHNHDGWVDGPNNNTSGGRSAQHDHGFTTDNRGSNVAHNNLQPYMAMYFLMKVA